MDHERRIQTVCAEHFGLTPSSITLVKRLMGGMSNYTYVIDVDGEQYTYRIPGKNAGHFVDRKEEAFHLPLAESLGISNDTVKLDIETGEKIGRYIEGTPMSEGDPLKHLKAVAALLKQVHHATLTTPIDYAPFARLTRYEALVRAYDHTHSDRYHAIKTTLLERHADFAADSTTFTHGDAQPSNFVITDQGLKLVDWEFTGNNDPYYDIAQFGNMNFDHARALLPVYLEREPDAHEHNRLHLWRAFQCLQWHNVALYKAFIGLSEELGIDFEKVAGIYLDKADAMIASLK